VWFGEVSLAGEVRPVAHAGLRLREATKLGFELGCGPEDGTRGGPGMRYHALTTLPKLVDRIMAAP
jgi:DNA repair protein RadA/Sms